MEPLLVLDAVSKSFQGRTVLTDVSLVIEAGEIVTLIGPNGAGKSTLIRIALGLTKPDGGRVTRSAGLTIGYMPQKVHVDALMPLTAERFLRLRPGVKAADAAAALGRVGLEGLGATPVQGLSGGEFQRLILARALLGRPRLLVLDEPVQGVDVGGQTALYRLISEVRRDLGCAVLMVSHDLHLVMSATDRVICLNTHICCSGAPQAVRADPAFRSLFGAGADALALYAHDSAHDHEHAHEHEQEGHHHAH